MKKLICLLFTLCFVVLPLFTVNVKASNEYQTYVEIMMTTGKLLRHFTDEEVEEYLSQIKGVHFYDIVVVPVNSNVQATYISNTLFSVDNTSATDVEYDVDVSLETNNKVTFSASGSLSGSGSGTIKKIKAEAAAKGSIEYSSTTTTSKKETKSMKIIVEANSRAIIYLTGELSVTNGVLAVYRFFFRAYEGGYEFVTLKSQYARIEKTSI